MIPEPEVDVIMTIIAPSGRQLKIYSVRKKINQYSYAPFLTNGTMRQQKAIRLFMEREIEYDKAVRQRVSKE